MRARAFFFCLALAGALPAQAHAQPAPRSVNEARAEARALANQGLELYKAGRYPEALTAFRDADRRLSAPTIRLMIARTHDKLGQLIQARKVYRAIVEQKLELYAPKVFFEAQDEAKRELEALNARIPTLQVTVTGAPANDLRLRINGRTVTAGKWLELDPGEYKVLASAPQRELAARRVTLQEGAKTQIALHLAATSGPAEPASPQRGYVGPAMAAFGLAGLAVGIGTVTGVLTLGRTSALEEECRQRWCYDDAGGDSYDSAHTLGAVSTASFVVGGVAAAAGVALLVWPRSRDGAEVGVVVRPGWTGLRAAF